MHSAAAIDGAFSSCFPGQAHKLSREAIRLKLRDTVADMAEALELPAETVPGAVKITLTGRRRALVEHHGGLLGYSGDCVEVGAGSGRVRIIGRELSLGAMDGDALLIRGTITAVEYG